MTGMRVSCFFLISEGISVLGDLWSLGIPPETPSYNQLLQLHLLVGGGVNRK